MTVKEPPKPPKSQKGKNQKSKKLRQDNDEILIAQFLEDNKHLAHPKTKNRTEAITTDGIIRDVLGIDPESNTGNIRGVVSTYLKSLDGWSTTRARVDGSKNPIRIWIFKPSFEKGGTEAKKPDSNSLQKVCHPPKKEIKSPDISTATTEQLENQKVDYSEQDILFSFRTSKCNTKSAYQSILLV